MPDRLLDQFECPTTGGLVQYVVRPGEAEDPRPLLRATARLLVELNRKRSPHPPSDPDKER